jgi:phosphate transport system permease protein
MTTLDVKPQRPWATKPRQLAPTALIFSGSFFATLLLLSFTALKGKLAFVIFFFLISSTINTVFSVRKLGRKALGDTLASSFIYAGSLLVFLPVFSILYVTLKKGIAGIHLTLFSQSMANASFLDPVGRGGLLHALIGTLYLILIAMIISVPMGVMTALYLTEIKGPGSNFIQFIVQAMSGVPSVVAGLFIFSSIILTTPIKSCALAGAFALAILMIPTVTRTSQEVLLLVPSDLREAGLAMGATQWRTVATIVVPAARNGLITATILGVARIAGETAPLIFTLGGADKINLNPFNNYNSALPFYVWKGLTLGTPESIARAWSGILVLIVLVLSLFILARTLGTQRMKK